MFQLGVHIYPEVTEALKIEILQNYWNLKHKHNIFRTGFEIKWTSFRW